MQSSIPLFSAVDLSLTIANNPIFSHISFSLYAREHTAIVGKNGCGKSTLLKLISSELRPPHIKEKPSLFWGFNGELDPSALEPKKYIRLVSPDHQTNYVRQGWIVTGREVVLSGLFNTTLLYNTPLPEELNIVESLAEQAGLTHLLGIEISAMSQGQLRAILLMRALVAKPVLLLLDEPFDGLDKANREALIKLMNIASEQGSTVVITAHRAEDIPLFVTNIYTPLQSDMLSIKQLEVSAFLSTEISKKEAPHVPDSLSNQAKVQSLSLDSEFVTLLQRQKKHVFETLPEGVDVFALDAVDVFINRKKVLHGIDWTVKKGEHWIISGSNGSGKSTLLRLLYGEEFTAWGGALRWFGRERVTLTELHALIGYVSDGLHYRYEHDLTAEEVILSGIGGTIGIYTEPSSEDRYIVQKWMEQLNLLSIAKKSYTNLSTGQARRILLTRSLAGAPPVLLLDEPFSGLDPESRKQFMNLLPQLASSGVQLIMVSHHEEDYSPVFTHTLQLSEGKITYSGKR